MMELEKNNEEEEVVLLHSVIRFRGKIQREFIAKACVSDTLDKGGGGGEEEAEGKGDGGTRRLRLIGKHILKISFSSLSFPCHDHSTVYGIL